MSKRRERKKAFEKIAASKIERAKAFKAVEAVSPVAAISVREHLLRDGIIEEAEFDRPLAGLREEDEFAIICKIMGTTTMIVDLGQRPLIKSDLIVPDFLVRFEAGCRNLGIPRSESCGLLCVVEVKSTDKDKFKLSGSLLRRRRRFADQLGTPLLIAVRFTRIRGNAVWALVWDRDRAQTSLTVDLQSIMGGVSRVVWDDFGLFYRPDLHIIRIYDNSSNKTGEVRHKQHGRLIGLRYVTRDHDVTLEGADAMVHGAFTTAIGLSFEREETQDNVTQIILRPNVMMSTFSNLMYRVNQVITDDEGNPVFDSSRIAAHADTDEFKWLVQRETGEQFCRELVHRELAFNINLGEEEDHRALWEVLFSNKT